MEQDQQQQYTQDRFTLSLLKVYHSSDEIHKELIKRKVEHRNANKLINK